MGEIVDAPIKIDHLQVARMEPGDILVLTVAQEITNDDAMRIQSYLKRTFPNTETLILGPGMELGIVRES